MKESEAWEEPGGDSPRLWGEQTPVTNSQLEKKEEIFGIDPGEQSRKDERPQAQVIDKDSPQLFFIYTTVKDEIRKQGTSSRVIVPSSEVSKGIQDVLLLSRDSMPPVKTI